MQIWIKVGTESVVLSRKFRIIIKPEKLGKMGQKSVWRFPPTELGPFLRSLFSFCLGNSCFLLCTQAGELVAWAR